MHRYQFIGGQQTVFPTFIVDAVVTVADDPPPAVGVLVLDPGDAVGVRLAEPVEHPDLDPIDDSVPLDVEWAAHPADRPELAGDTTSWFGVWSAAADQFDVAAEAADEPLTSSDPPAPTKPSTTRNRTRRSN